MASNANGSHSGIYTPLEDEGAVKVWTEEHRSTDMELADNLANTAVALHPSIIALLQKYGLDENATGIFASFRRGSAQKIADEVEHLLRKAASHDESAAACVVAAERIMRERVFVPVEMVKNQQKNQTTRTAALGGV